MKRILILFVILFIAFASCKKYGTGYIRGTVTEIGTGLPFPNVVVYLERWENYDWGSSKTNILLTIIDSMITDSKGQYNLSFNKRLGNPFHHYRYAIYCIPNHFVTDRAFYKSNTHTEFEYKKTTQDFSISPLAYVKIHVYKTSFVLINSSNLYLSYQLGGPFYNLTTHNYPFDTIQGTYTVAGNNKTYITWYQNYNSPPVVSKQENTLWVNKGDTITYDVHLN
jgi:hypothetical protein